jgi:hypothetical protein
MMDRPSLAYIILVVILLSFYAGLACGQKSAAREYKKELEWWINEPTVRVMDMNFTHTADLDIWKMNHASATVIKLVELPQKQHYGIYWLPAEEKKNDSGPP